MCVCIHAGAYMSTDMFGFVFMCFFSIQTMITFLIVFLFKTSPAPCEDHLGLILALILIPGDLVIAWQTESEISVMAGLLFFRKSLRKDHSPLYCTFPNIQLEMLFLVVDL